MPDFLEHLLTQERLAREERRVKTALKLSGLALGKTLEEYDYSFQRGLNKQQLDLLATTEVAKRKENVLFLGPPDVGKSHLAQGLGIRAIQNGLYAGGMTIRDIRHHLATTIGTELSHETFQARSPTRSSTKCSRGRPGL